MSAQPMVVARAGDRSAQQLGVFVHRPDDSAEEQQELGVVRRGLARVQQAGAVVDVQRPVVVLAASR